MVQLMLIEQFVDGGAHMRTESAGLLAAPVRRAQEEGRLLGRVVIPIRLPLTGFAAQMRLGQLRPGVEAHEGRPEPNVEPLADVARRNRVQARLNLSVAITPHLGSRPGHNLERRRGQWQHGRLLDRLEQQKRCAARSTVIARTSDPKAPPLGTGVDLLQAAKGAPSPEAPAYVGNLPLDPGFIFGFS